MLVKSRSIWVGLEALLKISSNVIRIEKFCPGSNKILIQSLQEDAF